MRHVRRSGGNVGSESRLALASSSGSQHGVGALALRDLQLRTLPSADGVGVTGRAWRSSSVLHAECWTCMQCDVAYPHAILACGACGQRCTAFGTTGYATGAEGTKGTAREPTLILCRIRSIRKDAERP